MLRFLFPKSRSAELLMVAAAETRLTSGSSIGLLDTTLPTLVSLDDIETAREQLAPVIRRTPVEHSEPLSNLLGRPVLLKAEHTQRTGSFKIRGAYHRIAQLHPAQRQAGVVAASAGNHAQGVALAASLLGVPSTIFMPEAAPLPKVQATRAYGAEVVLGGLVFDDALAAARSHAEVTGAIFVSPFDDPAVIAGQGTLGLELAEQAPEAGTYVVAVGGGGLISGVGAALKARRPDCRVVGVEAEGAASMTAALAAGRPVKLERIDTMADGIANKVVSDLTLAHVQAFVDEVVTVSEEDLSRALLILLERAKTLVEPAGAAPLAAALAGKLGEPSREPLCLVLSGGNVDPTLLIRVIRHGLSAAGRYLLVNVLLHDRPGELHRLLGVLARLGLNVLDVEHRRTGGDLPIDEAEVHLTLETRDPAHRAEVLAALAAEGYRAEMR
jgi:threonine dehydratase